MGPLEWFASLLLNSNFTKMCSIPQVIMGAGAFGLSGLVIFRQYRILTAVEYMILGVLMMSGCAISFSWYQIIKMWLSLLIVLIHTQLWYLTGGKILYFIGISRNSCHTSKALGNEIYHCSQSTAKNVPSEEYSKDIATSKRRQPTKDLSQISFWAPCMGFAVPFSGLDIRSDFKNCSKCHEWIDITMYLLTQDKFLTYSIVMYTRWITWICVSLNILLHVILLFMEKNLRDSHSIWLVDEFSGWFLMVSDLYHMGIVAIDICNLVNWRIEHNDNNNNMNNLKLVLLVIVMICVSVRLDSISVHIGYYVYVMSTIISAYIVHLIMKFGKSI